MPPELAVVVPRARCPVRFLRTSSFRHADQRTAKSRQFVDRPTRQAIDLPAWVVMAELKTDPHEHDRAPDGRPWRQVLAPYARPSVARSVLDLLTSVVPYFALCVVMYQLLDVSYWLALAVAIPASGFLLRTYILFHDCAHGSFLPSKRGNEMLGSVLAVIVYTPFAAWRHSHAVHHATAGDLDRRGTGDVMTWTVDEYRSKPLKSRIGYRLFRNPLVMMGLGPIYSMLIMPRFPKKDMRPRIRRSVLRTNLALLVIVGAFVYAIGLGPFLLVQLPVVILAGSAGVFLFYVQHQFEDVYWESTDRWSYDTAALEGSSYLRLPQPLQFFTGNIGLHHVHHLSARIPNYNLQRAHDDNPVFQSVPTLSFWDGVKCTRLKLWDEQGNRLIGWREERRSRPSGAATRAPAAAG
jgi:omega-6 fatty acid desaturase (delta-12 desaturase)